MKFFYCLIVLFDVVKFNLALEKANIVSFLSNYLTLEKNKLHGKHLRENIRTFNESSQKKDQFNFNFANEENREISDFLQTHKGFFSNKPKIKEIIKFFPSILFNSNKKETKAEEISFELGEEFENFLEEIENNYSEEHIDRFDQKNLYSSDLHHNRLLMLESLLDPNNEELKEKIINNRKNKKKMKFDFIPQEKRDKFKDLLDDFFDKQIQGKSEKLTNILNEKTVLHHENYEKQRENYIKYKSDEKFSISNSSNFIENITETIIPKVIDDEFNKNYSSLIKHLKKFEKLIKENNLSIEDLDVHLSEPSYALLQTLGHIIQLDENYSHDFPYIERLINKTYQNVSSINSSILFSKEKEQFHYFIAKNNKNYNHSFLQQDLDSALNTDLSNTENTEECPNPEQKSAVSEALDDLASFGSSLSEDADSLLDKKEVKSGKTSSILNFQVKMIIAMIKMVVNAIVSIITGFFRIIVPPAILAFFSCPEAGFMPANLIHIIDFDEKTEQIVTKIEAYPQFFETFAPKDASTFSYYLCAQGLFTSECSAVWPKFMPLAYIFTNPPFTTIIFLIMFPLLDWLQLLPGDMPMCFLCCIQVLLQCKGIKFSEIPQCGGLYNLDTLLRAIFDLALLVFLGLSMVPGICTYNPFIINMWMIPPRLMTEEDKMMRKAPKLKALLKKAQKDPDFKDFSEPCSTKKEETKPSPFEDGLSSNILDEIQRNTEGIEDQKNQQSPEDQEGLIPIESIDDTEKPSENIPWWAREITGDYTIENWGKQTTPDKTVFDPFKSQSISDMEGSNNEADIHATQREKITIPKDKNSKSILGDAGMVEWDYPIGQ